MQNIYNKISESQRNNEKIAICTIVSTKGSAPLHQGSKMIVWESGQIYATIGGGNLEKKVIENAIDVIKKGRGDLFKHQLLRQHGMCCGGTVEIFIEPVMPSDKLYIFGAGHIGKALAQHASKLDFQIFLIDERENVFNNHSINGVDHLPLNHIQILNTLPFDENTFIAIVTHDHELDREILGECINKKYAYLGVVGSQRKIEVTRKIFLSSGIISEQDLNKVDMPIGLGIGAVGPNEIAISILAKLIEVKNYARQKKMAET